jgi:hypothetical protein
MASIVRIKRSEVSGNPAVLGQGELAYSALADNGSNGGDRLYIGMGTETAGNAVNHVVIGGKYFTDAISAATNANTASTIVKRDSSGNFSAGTITAALSGNATTATTWVAARDLSLTGDATATLSAVNGSTNVSAALTLATVNSNTGNFGSTTTIPVITVNAKGLVTAVSTAAISSSFTIAADSGTPDVFNTGETLSFVGGEGIDTSISAATNTVTISAEDATTSNKGVASFNSASFSVTSGDVTIKNAGVSNSQLVNSQVTIGSNAVSLGSTITTLTGLSEVGVDNLNLNANTLSATNTDGNVVLSPNGTGVVDVTDSRIVGVATPVNGTDAANKAYVDNAVTGLTFKQAVNLKADNNVSLSGSSSTLVIDGHSALDQLDNNYRILLVGQTTSSENGIYTYQDNGVSYTLTRSVDSDVYTEIIGASVFVLEGVTYANTGWVQTNHYLTSFSGQTWVQFSGAGAYVAGEGLTLTGTTFDVGAGDGISVTANAVSINPSLAGNGLTHSAGVINAVGTANRISVSSDAIDIASTYVGQTSITTLGTISTGTWSADTIATTKGGTGLTTYATGDILYASGSNTLAKLSIGAIGKVFQVNGSGVPVWADIDGGTY